jgi:hypothetical protein
MNSEEIAAAQNLVYVQTEILRAILDAWRQAIPAEQRSDRPLTRGFVAHLVRKL